jgi:hypothetical protein
MYSRKVKQSKKSYLPAFLIVFALLLIGTFVTLEFTGITHLFHHDNPVIPVTTASQNTKGIPHPSSTVSDKQSNESIKAVVPTGDFVSNHHPNLSGSPAPNTMTSVCTTTPGASCKISFTNTSTGVVKSLPSQTTDAGGSTYWGWKLQDIGLSAGTWKIQATAGSGDQAKVATDPMDLVVEP